MSFQSWLSILSYIIFFKDGQILTQALIKINKCSPNPPSLAETQLSPPFSTCDAETKKALAQRHPDQNKDTGQILQTYGYLYKEYNVSTKDGYILTVYRIMGSVNDDSTKEVPKQAVFLQHGLKAASDCWFFQPGTRNLPFKLVDAGYEVWLGNARGTSYSLGHKKYNSDKDLPYWDFSWHDMGIYDIPAVTDTILRESKNEKMFYVGHSMGTTQYFVSLSEIPEMNDKILAGFMFAPIAYIGHCNNPQRRAFPLVNTHAKYQVVNVAAQGRLQSAQQFRTLFNVSEGDACALTAAKCGLCDNLVFMLYGYDAPQMNNSELPNMRAKFPNSASIKTSAHYSQIGSNCNFAKYDYGKIRNVKVYKSETAPEYKLKNIKAPTFLYYGEQDTLGPPNDVHVTASKFSREVVKAVHKIKHRYFNHVDFILAKDADALLYDVVLREMKKFK